MADSDIKDRAAKLAKRAFGDRAVPGYMRDVADWYSRKKDERGKTKRTQAPRARSRS